MTLKPKILDLLNKQINEELFSMYLYLSMAAWFESQTLKGFAHWMKIQAQEEQKHAMKIFEYIHDAGGSVNLTTIAGPKTKWDSPLQVLEETCAHEAKITNLIHSLLEQSISEKDFATQNMLQWFVSEQVEEEAIPAEILAKLKMIGTSQGGLLYLDKELKKRES